MFTSHVDGLRLSRWIVLVLFAAFALVEDVSTAQAAPPPRAKPSSPASPGPGGRSNLAVTPQPTNGGGETIAELHIRESDLASALRMLTMQTHDNVVLSGKVSGEQKVEANLYNVTFEQVLDSILTPLGLVYQRTGNVI